MVGWGTSPGDIENPQRVASSEGEELFVGNLMPLHPHTKANNPNSEEAA